MSKQNLKHGDQVLRGSVKTEEDKDEQRLEKMSFKQRRKHLQKNDCVLHITRGNQEAMKELLQCYEERCCFLLENLISHTIHT